EKEARRLSIALFPRGETRRRLVPARGDEASPYSHAGRRGVAPFSLLVPFSFLASSPRAGRRKPADEESPASNGLRGEPRKSSEPPGGAALKRATWTLSEALGPRLARALRRALKRLLQPLLRRRS
ncbi:hypothetical protein BHE74_00033146, partial [Ensete ventricosum]